MEICELGSKIRIFVLKSICTSVEMEGELKSHCNED